MYEYSVDNYLVFFFNDTATTEIYTLSLHDALPISVPFISMSNCGVQLAGANPTSETQNVYLEQRSTTFNRLAFYSFSPGNSDRKSTRLNSSHANISYAVFCLKKKNSITDYTFHSHI